MSIRIGQSVCRTCGQPVHPGSGIVLRYGSGGRKHRKECPMRGHKPAITHADGPGGVLNVIDGD